MNQAPKSHSKKHALEWQDYLKDSQGLGGILAKTEDMVKLKSALAQCLDELDLANLSSKIEAGWRSGGQKELFLLVGSASIASRLQQVLPSLINGLAKRGYPCSSIKVRLKPATTGWEVKPREAQRTPARGFNSVARASWQNLMEKLPQDSELRKAVERLLGGK